VIDAALRNLVRQRAGHRCEYCGFWQWQIPVPLFHIEHIVPKKHGGDDDPSNLALACHHRNLHKGPNLTGIDPEIGNVTSLFHPRNERWETHFVLQDDTIIGLSPVGRTTIQVLDMNAAERVQLREKLRARG